MNYYCYNDIWEKFSLFVTSTLLPRIILSENISSLETLNEQEGLIFRSDWNLIILIDPFTAFLERHPLQLSFIYSCLYVDFFQGEPLSQSLWPSN